MSESLYVTSLLLETAAAAKQRWMGDEILQWGNFLLTHQNRCFIYFLWERCIGGFITLEVLLHSHCVVLGEEGSRRNNLWPVQLWNKHLRAFLFSPNTGKLEGFKLNKDAIKDTVFNKIKKYSTVFSCVLFLCMCVYIYVYTYIKSPIYLWDLHVNKKINKKFKPKKTTDF